MTLTIPTWSTTELDVMRVGLGLAVVTTFARIHLFRPTDELEYPVGFARIVDLRWAASRTVVRRTQFAAYVAALFYVADLLVPYALVFLTVAIIVDVTYRSSFGGVNHGDHLLAIVLTAQTGAVLLWNAAEHWGWDVGSVVGTSQQATAAWWAIQAIIAAYFVSGLSKLVRTRGRWVQRSPGLLLSSVARVETDRLMGPTSWGSSAKSTDVVLWLLERPALARSMFAAGLLVELLTPVGFVGKPALAIVGICLLCLHWANGYLLGLPFREYQLLVLVFLVNVPQLFT